MVDFPLPLGAENIRSFPGFCMVVVLGLRFVLQALQVFFLQRVKNLFLYLFELVFHLDHDVLHFGQVAFAAERVYFAPYFLRDEAEFLALAEQETLQIVSDFINS